MKQTYRYWLALCDRIISTELGVSLHDLIDCCWRDMYDDGLSPREATADILSDPHSYI